MKTGFKNTQELIFLLVSLGLAVKNANADGQINAADLGQLITVVPTISPALEGVNQIPHELKDLDAEELETIKSQVISAVGQISGEKATRIAQHSLTAGVALVQLVNTIRSDDAAQDTPAVDVAGSDEEG